MWLTKQEKTERTEEVKAMIERTVKENKENMKDRTPVIENYYALLAVILNPKLSVDEAIRYFRL